MKKILKRCEKCGGTSLVAPRERRCKRQAFGPRSYACWGKLAREVAAKEKLTVQQAATIDLVRANRMLDEKLTELQRLVTSIQRWRKRATYHAYRAGLTDAELAQMSAARQARKRRPRLRRGIDV